MNNWNLRNLIIALWFASLIALVPWAYAVGGDDNSNADGTSEAVESEVQAQTDDEAAKRRQKIMQDAVAALAQTKDALQALEDNRIDDALENLAVATGKLELIVSRDPRLALAPTDVSVASYDIYATPAAIRAAIADAQTALEDGEVQLARRILSGLRSETVITVANLPLATYPDAIKAITPLIDDGRIDEAKRGLQVALNMLVLTDHIVALPVLRSEELLKRAEELAENADRSDEQNEELSDQLAAARNQLEMAELLGYGDNTDFGSLYAQLDQIETKTGDGRSGSGFFDNINEKIKTLIGSTAS